MLALRWSMLLVGVVCRIGLSTGTSLARRCALSLISRGHTPGLDTCHGHSFVERRNTATPKSKLRAPSPGSVQRGHVKKPIYVINPMDQL